MTLKISYERAIVKQLDGLDRIVTIPVKEDGTIYAKVLLENNNFANFVKLSTNLEVPMYNEVEAPKLFQ